jgi:hypothetical protein
MKSLDDINPRTTDIKWKDQILWAEMPKIGEWYNFRIVGGIFCYAQHWVKITTKDNKEATFPIDCLGWSSDLEAVDPSKAHLCPGCQAGIKPAIKYLFNVIDRSAQGNGAKNYIKGFELPPTAMKKITDLKNLNMVQGRPTSVANADHGCDLYIQKTTIQGKKGFDWAFQKGDRAPLTDEERNKELFEFDEIYVPGDANNARQSLIRAGFFKNEGPAQGQNYAPPSGAQMPPSGAQMPPSGGQMPPKQNPIGFQAPQEVPTQAPAHVQLPMHQDSTPATITGGLGKPPAADQGQTSRPACFGGFLGTMDCIKCPHKPQCLQATSERS